MKIVLNLTKEEKVLFKNNLSAEYWRLHSDIVNFPDNLLSSPFYMRVKDEKKELLKVLDKIYAQLLS